MGSVIAKGFATAGVVLLVMTGTAAAASPHAVITSGPPATTKDRSATFTFKESGFVLLPSFECRLDGGAWARCTSPQSYADLGGGTHTFEVRLASLLADSTPALATWVVDLQTTTAPPCSASCVNPKAPAKPPVASKKRRYAIHGCAYAAARPSQATRAQLVRAVECLMSYERTQRGLQAVRPNGTLRLIARRQASDMVRRRYFAHAFHGLSTLASRALPYFRVGPGDVGEILAWGSSTRSTPVSVTLAWLRSPTHREILLTPHYREVGAGIAGGVPSARHYKVAATYAVEFGRRG